MAVVAVVVAETNKHPDRNFDNLHILPGTCNNSFIIYIQDALMILCWLEHIFLYFEFFS